ncbi:uncharacterized protein At5g39865-like [Henckelia pumila]|uniref:uncharacterized protein At5g39865-like n=1 Tax=Henckelia pumila TaxID=405737 RepID=UPI003C6E1819
MKGIIIRKLKSLTIPTAWKPAGLAQQTTTTPIQLFQATAKEHNKLKDSELYEDATDHEDMASRRPNICIQEKTDQNPTKFIVLPTQEIDGNSSKYSIPSDQETTECNFNSQLTGNESVILYTTSLRGIRKTFEDCGTIRFLLQSFRIVYYERDVSMHLEYREELWGILGRRVIPPKLFIRGRCIGGADEVVGLHEKGMLINLVKGIPLNPSNYPCKGCGGIHFVLCSRCNGSRKVMSSEGQNAGSPIRCQNCNENGLIKCMFCS